MTNVEAQPVEGEIKERQKIFWQLFEVDVKDCMLVDNIRPIDPLVVEEIANSISEIGQLNPCIGDFFETENGAAPRIAAGQHRYHSVVLLNERGEPTKLLARLAINRSLTDEEILSIQMSENLQNKMTAEQDARVIHAFWLRCQEMYGEENVSMVLLSRKLGRSPQKISEAIKFVEGLSPKVQEMVHNGVLHYSTALLLTKLNGQSHMGSDYYSEQVRKAVFLISQGYNKVEARKYLEKISKEERSYTEPLFSGEVWGELKKNGYRIAIRDKSSKEGRTASGWFVRMMKAIALLDDPTKAEFSVAIEKAVEELDISMDDFQKNLQDLGVKL